MLATPFAALPSGVPNFFEACSSSLLADEPSLSLSSSGELDDLLLVPDVFPARKCQEDLWNLDSLFGEDSASEAATVLCLSESETASDASTRLPSLDSPPQQHTSSTPASSESALRPAVVPKLPPSGLSLKLDYASVARAWSELGGGRLAMGISAAELVRVAANIPSLADQAASLSAEAALAAAGDSSDCSQGPAGVPLTEEEAQARKAALARYKEKKSARANNPSKKVRYEMRRINAEKRPRIKGRFVKKSELELYLAQQNAVANDCMVPAI